MWESVDERVWGELNWWWYFWCWFPDVGHRNFTAALLVFYTNLVALKVKIIVVIIKRMIHWCLVEILVHILHLSNPFAYKVGDPPTKTVFSFSLAVATPKQIRELMKVDGLTNDEVKSHLQVLVYCWQLPLLGLAILLMWVNEWSWVVSIFGEKAGDSGEFGWWTWC